MELIGSQIKITDIKSQYCNRIGYIKKVYGAAMYSPQELFMVEFSTNCKWMFSSDQFILLLK